jgi:hypothetical protein
MFNFIKKTLRISCENDDFDDEIYALIDEAKDDLARSGITNENTPLYRRAVANYALANFGQRDDSDKFVDAYETVKRRIMVTQNE